MPKNHKTGINDSITGVRPELCCILSAMPEGGTRIYGYMLRRRHGRRLSR